MLAIACHALDIGSMSSIFWSFEEKENIMEFYERVSGARMHAAFHRPATQFNFILEISLIHDILNFVKNCYKTLNEMHNVLSYNKIWKQRLINIGTINSKNIISWNLTGVMARSVGYKKDLRLSKKHSYSNYNQFSIKSFLGINGDCYDRYLIRMLEMAESLNVINLVSNYLLYNKVNKNLIYQQLFNKNFNLKTNNYSYMEDLIEHFIHWHTGITIKKTLHLII